MFRTHAVYVTLHIALLASTTTAAPPRPSNPATFKKIADLERLLPDFESAANDLARELRPLLSSNDTSVRLAVDGALLRLAALRSVRTIIATDPDFLAHNVSPAALTQWQEALVYFLESARSKRDPYAGATNGLRTCRSATDGQILFYRIKVPADYSPKKRYPLDIDLHYAGALTWRAGWVDGPPSRDPRQANKDQRIWISPCGRGNNSYAGLGETAVIEVLRDVVAHYSIDEDRITVGGVSMGGAGGFRMAGFYPDLFAAGHSLTGWPNYSVPADQGRFDPTLLLDNLGNTGLCLWYEPHDLEGAGNLAYMKGLPERAQRHSGYYPHRILLDPKGSHGVIDQKLRDQGWDWIRRQRRPPWPKRVAHKTYSLRYPGAFWAHLDTIEDPRAPSRIEAELHDGERIDVKVYNCDRFNLNLARGLVGDRQTISVVVNGKPINTTVGKKAYFGKSNGTWSETRDRYPSGLVKKHGVSGPILDLFLGGPVLMVRGTADDQSEIQGERIIDAALLRLLGPGDGGNVLHSPFERKADVDVDKSDWNSKHLVLFGTPRQNHFVRRIADRLPVTWSDEGVSIGGTNYTGRNVGLVMIYPNPLNPERYILLLPENYGRYTALGFSSIYTLPDYVVGRPTEAANGLTMEVLADGTFDSRWQLPKK
jgi:hypothetical protein